MTSKDVLTEELIIKFLLEKASKSNISLIKRDHASPQFRRFVQQIVRDSTGENVDYNDIERLFYRLKTFWLKGQYRSSDSFDVSISRDEKERVLKLFILSKDRPFLVESITEELTRVGLTMSFFLNATIAVRRNERGSMLGVGGEGEARESWIWAEMRPVLSSSEIEELHFQLSAVLSDLQMVVDDFSSMSQKLRGVIDSMDKKGPVATDKEDHAETVAFLRWLLEGHFTILGYRRYDIVPTGKNLTITRSRGADAHMGIMRDPKRHILKMSKEMYGDLNPAVEAFLRSPEILLITKANSKSKVRRQVYMDYVGIKIFDDEGKAVGEHRFIGLFTYETYRYSIMNIPILRKKARSILERSLFNEGDYNYRQLVNIIETYPRDEIFQTSTDELFDSLISILRLNKRPRVKVLLRRDRFDRFVSVLVFMTRDRYNTEARMRVGHVLKEAFQGRVSAYYVQFGEVPLARVHYIIGIDPGAMLFDDVIYLERKIEEITRSWISGLQIMLTERDDFASPNEIFHKYGEAFPVAYQDRITHEEAIEDIKQLETMLDDSSIHYRTLVSKRENKEKNKPETGEFEITLYSKQHMLNLSHFIPIFDNMGLSAFRENNYSVCFDKKYADYPVWIHDFFVKSTKINLKKEYSLATLEEAIIAILSGEAENDSLNRLIMLCGIPWEKIRILRALAQFTVQTNIGYSFAYISDSLTNNTDLSEMLLRQFEIKFDPRLDLSEKERKKKIEEGFAAFYRALANVISADEDRIFRHLINMIEAMVRTNAYQKPAKTDAPPKPGLSFKIASSKVNEIPQPRPYREIFVSSRDVEGVHLRFGAVARGGLRWSNRREDYRTEVLGLVKAQNVKNSLIVAKGAKGVFYPQNLPASGDAQAYANAGRRAYKIFVSSLLSLTDNYYKDVCHKPKDTLCYDGYDPYFVVAADKGTARFSDVANEIAAQYGFWLGDAFASGGSIGYDHKKMGITARGAWVAVRSHFLEMGKDISKEAFSVAGVGDMSGDIFGNGMLLSHQIRLVAAFDHRHIFIDPDPDPEISFKERRRLFQLPSSSWDSYDRDLLSKGGGIYSRQSKEIVLSEQAKAALKTTKGKFKPDDLIAAVLKAPVELLWMGGIGTYCKATQESHLEVGDKVNDALRVNAADLRASVIGEGANLGLTQAARIEYALRGGRINTDAVDNSAGVDCSDHEVNIKILLQAAMENGALGTEDRDALLASMTEDVAQFVLGHNHSQTRALSMERNRGRQEMDHLARIINQLEGQGKLNRLLESLPDSEIFEQRKQSGTGLMRPELAVVMAYYKNDLVDRLLKTNIVNEDIFQSYLVNYFPEPLRQFEREIRSHRLRREIIATELANDLIESMGITLPYRMQTLYGMTTEYIARAYHIARSLFGLDDLVTKVAQINSKETPADIQTRIYLQASQFLREQLVFLYLSEREKIHSFIPLNGDEPLSDRLEKTTHEVRKLKAYYFRHLDAEMIARDRVLSFWRKAPLPEEVKRDVYGLVMMKNAVEIIQIAQAHELPTPVSAEIYTAVIAGIGVDVPFSRFETLETLGHYENRERTLLMDEFRMLKLRLVSHIVAATRNSEEKEEKARVAVWLRTHASQLRAYGKRLGFLELEKNVTLSKLALAVRETRSLYEWLL